MVARQSEVEIPYSLTPENINSQLKLEYDIKFDDFNNILNILKDALDEEGLGDIDAFDKLISKVSIPLNHNSPFDKIVKLLTKKINKIDSLKQQLLTAIGL